MSGIRKKLDSIIEHGVAPYKEGKRNFENPKPEIEALAEERAKHSTCLVEEPILFLQVADPRIPKLSNMMCGECGCTAAYKFRQSKDKCECWEK